MEERLARLLRTRVEAYLTALERLLVGGGPDEEAWRGPRLRLELGRTVAAWRSLLEVHPHDGRRCRHCDRGLGVRRTGLCSVWRTAHAHFVVGVPPHGPRPGGQA